MVDTPLDFEPRVDILGQLPLELFVRILEELHPTGLLAVARTNKRFHEFLRDKQNEHVWRTSRQIHADPEIPDPVQISEYAMASLLFDQGECMICGNRSDEVFVWSYAYGERVCTDKPCRAQIRSGLTKPRGGHADLIYSLVPSEYICNLSNHPPFTHCGVEREETNARAIHWMCKKKDAKAILGGLAAGLTEEQLREKYKSTTEMRDQYLKFVRQLKEASDTFKMCTLLTDIPELDPSKIRVARPIPLAERPAITPDHQIICCLRSVPNATRTQ